MNRKMVRGLPFTFAHPLFAAPLKFINPKYLSLTGLILGSMAPDFEYFIALEPYQYIGHTTKGLFLLAIPLCILIAYLFHSLVKAPLAQNLPSLLNLSLNERAQSLIQPWKLDSIQQWVIFLASVTLGFYSHIFIDAFTHKSGFFAARSALLQDYVLGIPIYKWLQHTSSMLGLTLEALFLIFMLKNIQLKGNYVKVKSKEKALYWFIVLVITAAITISKIVLSDSTNVIGILVVSPISGFFVGIILASFIYRMTSERRIAR
ncbi:DUF4184 family protein [Paenibacillus eucommiae]|uniref:Phosphate/sulfate permease n=1 Tax=Paenibacillus eucommiae TaxID=1355755 RepID=A0ABS4ISP8_9BACL|nr:DUF4184 family protein [Paenibacillus eucommiae]MBP1990602.1 phosphate/sulfate permease [Paenibacillus eucommiae]